MKKLSQAVRILVVLGFLSSTTVSFQNCSAPMTGASNFSSESSKSLDPSGTTSPGTKSPTSQIPPDPSKSGNQSQTSSSSSSPAVTQKIWGLDLIKKTTIGLIDGKSDEFKNGKPVPNISEPGTTAAEFKNWVGRSDCASCPTSPQYQTFVWGGLVVGNSYEIDLYPGTVVTPPTIQDPNVPMSMNFEVLVNEGAVDFLDGSNVRSMHPYPSSKPVWRIRFVARTNVLKLSIGTQEPSVVNYMYIDAYEFLEFGPFKAPGLTGRYLTFAHMYQGSDNFYMMHGVAQLMANGRARVSFYFVDVNEARPRYAEAPGIPFTFQCNSSVPYMYKPPFTQYYSYYETTWSNSGFNSFVLNLLGVGFTFTTDVDDRVRLKPGVFNNSSGYGFLSDNDPIQSSPINYRTIPNHTETVGSASDYFVDRPLRHSGLGYNPAAFAFSDNFATNTTCPGLTAYAYNQSNEMGLNIGYFQGGGHSYWLYSIKNAAGVVDRTLIIENSTKASEPGKFYIGISRTRAL